MEDCKSLQGIIDDLKENHFMNWKHTNYGYQSNDKMIELTFDYDDDYTKSKECDVPEGIIKIIKNDLDKVYIVYVNLSHKTKLEDSSELEYPTRESQGNIKDYMKISFVDACKFFGKYTGLTWIG